MTLRPKPALLLAAFSFLALSSCGRGAAPSGSPTLSVYPATLQFSAVLSQPFDPPPSSIVVSNSGTGTLTFAASTDAPWLAVSPAGGSAPQMLQASAMMGTLAPGTYTGHVIITSDRAAGSPASVTVNFTVAPPPAGR